MRRFMRESRAMAMYRRSRLAGGTFFFTLVTNHRLPLFSSRESISNLRTAFRAVQRERPFTIPAIVVLPDHLHMLMTLPGGDDDYSSRIGKIKVLFTKSVSAEVRSRLPGTASRTRHRESGIWQRRFWEHTIRDERDFNRHVEYIHFNPVRHGLVSCPHGWPWSSFHRWVRMGVIPSDWACGCNGRAVNPPDVEGLARRCGE